MKQIAGIFAFIAKQSTSWAIITLGLQTLACACSPTQQWLPTVTWHSNPPQCVIERLPAGAGACACQEGVLGGLVPGGFLDGDIHFDPPTGSLRRQDCYLLNDPL